MVKRYTGTLDLSQGWSLQWMGLGEKNRPNLYTVGPGKHKIAKRQGKNFQLAILNVFKDVKEDMNKSLNKVYENTIKMIQGIK